MHTDNKPGKRWPKRKLTLQKLSTAILLSKNHWLNHLHVPSMRSTKGRMENVMESKN